MKKCVMVAVFFVLTAVVYAESLYCREKGSWPFGPSYAVALDPTRNLAFVGSGGGVYILDVSNPSSPVKVSETIYTRGVVYSDAAKDVGVSKIISPLDKPFWPWGDTLYPICEVTNYGTDSQSSFSVRCRMWDTLTHSIVYDEVHTVGALEPMQKCTVYFTPFFPPPLEEHLYIDTMRTELTGDQVPTNDAIWMSHRITEWGGVWLLNHDGGFENIISWVSPNGEWAARFPQTPSPNLHINWVGVWVGSYGNDAYPGQMIVYGWNDSTSAPKSDPIAVEDVTIQTVPVPNLYHNIFELECTVPDSPFVVSYKQLSVSPSYPYIGMDNNSPIDNNDAWCRHPSYTGDTWYTLSGYAGYVCDMSIEAAYAKGRLIDAELKGFPFPDTLNSDTVITFAVQVKNAGLVDRKNIKVNIFFVHDSGSSHYAPGETLFALEGNTGSINPGEIKTVTFPDTWRTQLGKYTFTGYIQLLYDKNYENDSSQQVIFIRELSGVREEKVDAYRFGFTLTPNPLVKGSALLSYSVLQRGKAQLKVYDVTGRTVMSLSFIASQRGTKRLDLRRLSGGVYWVKFETPSEEAIQKLIIR